MEFNINISVTGATPTEAADLLDALRGVMRPAETEARKSPAPVETPALVEVPASEEAPALVEVPVGVDAPAPAETPKPAPRPWIPEMEEVRAAIEATRRRIEGADYENAASEGRKKYHDVLTREFRRIAETYGAPKPPLLAADKRADFIRDCEALILDANGKITQQVPF